uniref:Uncharacterized protein n=1 Tax=Cacopsylla melanoneura TaxID=428564 RepID=A0A8D8XQ55_9HEMI
MEEEEATVIPVKEVVGEATSSKATSRKVVDVNPEAVEVVVVTVAVAVNLDLSVLPVPAVALLAVVKDRAEVAGTEKNERQKDISAIRICNGPFETSPTGLEPLVYWLSLQANDVSIRQPWTNIVYCTV